MIDGEGAIGHEVIQFVDNHVGSLCAWDIIVFFHRHPDEAFHPEILASQLGRGPAELIREIEALSAEGVLQTAGGLVRFSSDSAIAPMVTMFVEACRNRAHRLSLIARVLQGIAATSEE